MGTQPPGLLARASELGLAPTVFSVLRSRVWVQRVLFVGVDEPLNLEIQVMGCMDQLMWAVESGKGLLLMATAMSIKGNFPSSSFFFGHWFPEFSLDFFFNFLLTRGFWRLILSPSLPHPPSLVEDVREVKVGLCFITLFCWSLAQ